MEDIQMRNVNGHGSNETKTYQEEGKKSIALP